MIYKTGNPCAITSEYSCMQSKNIVSIEMQMPGPGVPMWLCKFERWRADNSRLTCSIAKLQRRRAGMRANARCGYRSSHKDPFEHARYS